MLPLRLKFMVILILLVVIYGVAGFFCLNKKGVSEGEARIIALSYIQKLNNSKDISKINYQINKLNHGEWGVLVYDEYCLIYLKIDRCGQPDFMDANGCKLF